MRVYLRGKTWWGDWMEPSAQGPVRRRRSLGLRSPLAGEAEALAVLHRLLSDAERPYTVGELMDDWLRSKRIEHHSKPRSIEAFGCAARRFGARWGELPVDALDAAAIDAFKEERLRDVAPATLNVDLDHLRNALRFARERGRLSAPPTVRRVRDARRRVPKLLSQTEVGGLIALVSADGSAPGERFSRLEPIVRLAIAGGLRSDEVRWLRWCDVDLQRGLLHVRSKPGWSPKSSAERTVPMHCELVRWLTRWRASLTRILERGLLAEDWVAPFLPLEGGRGGGQGVPGRQWVRGVLTQELRRLFEAAGVPRVGPHHLHKLRGTFAVRVLEGGGSLESLREILGHADLRSTAVYLAATDAAKRRAVSVVGWDD